MSTTRITFIGWLARYGRVLAKQRRPRPHGGGNAWLAGRIGEGFDVLRRLVSSLVPTSHGPVNWASAAVSLYPSRRARPRSSAG